MVDGLLIDPRGGFMRLVIAGALPVHGGAMEGGSEVEVWEAAGGEGGIEILGGY